MVAFSLLSLLFVLPVALTAPGELFEKLSTPAYSEHDKRAGTFFTFWKEGNGIFECTNRMGGSYTAKWTGNGGFVCGKGYNPGGNRPVRYTGTYSAVGPGYLALYGWTRDPLIEYYMVDSYDVLLPGEPWTHKGNFTSDEGTYEIYTSLRVNKPSIDGTRNFTQYWSLRTEKRVGGTITSGKHYDAWGRLGMRVGRHDYMVLVTEGFAVGENVSSGSSSITVD